MASLPPTRRDLLGALPCALSLAALARTSWAGSEERARASTAEDPARRERRRRAIERGASWLAVQQRTGGGFGDDKAVVALTALSVMALQASGSAYGRGPHGLAVKRGIDFLLQLVETPSTVQWHPEGYFHHPGDTDSRMHGQGYAALALATALGMAPGPRAERLRSAVAKAVRCMEAAQTSTGGYGYSPSPDNDHEGSVTVCVAQALRAARDAGLTVSQGVVLRGLEYLRKSQVASDGASDGGFTYSITHTKHTYALTAAAISSFYLFGRYKDDPRRTLDRGMRYMLRALERGAVDEEWWYYGHFYGAWAFWQRDGGDWSSASMWGRWAALVLPELVGERQRSDGSWDDRASGKFHYGPVLSTAFAVLTLSIPDEALPVFQR